ncbi:MAG TPA: hypothetical protein VHV76_11500 [Mycobacteriales bacterium]|nr:hypothetical protein [Mycobacteriales bacterium]
MQVAKQLSLVVVLASCVAACGGSSAGPTETAAHRPPLMQVGAPAPVAFAAPLLRPADLGPTWRYRTTPAVETKPESTPPPGQTITGETGRVQAILWASHWNGERWQVDADIIEYAVTFASHADGRRFVQPNAHPTNVAGHQVWTLSKNGQGGPDGVMFEHGTTVIQMIIGHGANPAPSTLSTPDILRAAVHRAFASG